MNDIDIHTLFNVGYESLSAALYDQSAPPTQNKRWTSLVSQQDQGTKGAAAMQYRSINGPSQLNFY
ncbi:MAG: hypothetical protein HGB28_02110 [Oscillochloris sp.]|nr:hypothetical protein [Oscillochloris sp.]